MSHNKQEVLEIFEQVGYLDCRINGIPMVIQNMMELLGEYRILYL
jgi:hypothetical protein